MRNKFDYYPTPEWCYEKLPVDWSQFNSALEPGSGDGRIVNFLEKISFVEYVKVLILELFSN